MKKFLYGMMAATMIFATSCENELELGAAGEESVVSFTISTPDMGSRAYSDGSTATVLQYAVYEGETELKDLTKSVVKGNAETINGSKEVQLKLTTGNTYSVIFWAAAPNAPYTVDFANKTMKVNYEGAVSNDENRDAFYAKETFTVNGAQNETITLKRPFAQLNIGTNDYAASTSAGYTPTQSKVVVSNVYGKLNLWDGDVDSSVVASFDFAAIDTTEQFPVSGFKYLAMNYALVSKDKETVEVAFSYKEATGEAKTRKVGSVPVQRNYRTNIYGQLLTSDVDVNVEIKPEFDGVTEEITNIVNNLNELQAALDAATTGTTTIYLGKDIEGNVTEIQKPGRKIIIEGGNNKLIGAIKVHSNSNHYADAALTIKNLNFETSTASVNFIEALENGSERYSCNITVENCTFTATGEAVNTAVGVQIKSSKNAKVIGCTATNMHSLIQAQSCDEEVLVQDCTITGKNGVAFKQVKNAVVEKITITAASYGIRFDGNTDNYGITAKNIDVTAVQPFIVRKMTGKNNIITLEGTNNKLKVGTSRADASKPYQIIITNGSDDEPYVIPTGTYTLTGADKFTIFPEPPVAKVGNTEYTSIDEAIANWTNNTTLTLVKDVTLNDVITLKSTEHHILNLGTCTMTAASGKNAIEITPYGDGAGTAAKSCLTINADATDPGSINAGSKSCIYYKKTNGINDRIMVTINGGIFDGTISSSSNNGGQACPYFVFNGGVFNKSINLTKAMLKVTGGIFHGMFSCTGDSTAHRLISGGIFKSWTFMTADAANKFCVGTDKQTYNVGVYVNDEGYLVVGGPVITDFGDKFAAKATNATKWSSYLKYSSAAEHGLYYTNAEMAIKKHGEANVELK